MGVLDQLLDEEDLQPVAKPTPILETQQAIPVETPKKLKRYIYLISPQEIRGNKFYNQLDLVLKTKKVKYFQA